MANTDELLGLARLEHQHLGATPFSSGTLTGPVNLGQLRAALDCWFVVDHPGLDDTGAKTVVAACPQDRLDAALAAYVYDPLWGHPNLTALAAAVTLAEKVLAGTATFTAAQMQAVAAHLILHHAREA